MIGFDAIGQAAIGELAGDAADVLLFAPSTDVGATIDAPVVHGGAAVAPAAAAVAVVANVPSIRAGARVTVPGAAVVVASSAAAVQISATMTIGVASVAVSIVAPAVHGGASVAPATDSVAVTRVAPAVTAGKAVFVPVANVTAAAFSPGISIGATISPAGMAVEATLDPPQVLGGNYIEANNTVTMITPYGEIGSSSIGEFAIGEGELSTRIVKIPPIVIVMSLPPFITAGKSAFPAAANINVTSARAEIDGRTRKLRALAIAS